MKYPPLIVFLISPLFLFGQKNEPPEIADPFERAVHEFKKPFEEQDYSKAIELLEQLKNEYPDSLDIRYFLGYAYDRLNCKHGGDIPTMTFELTQKASEEFEYIVKNSPKYDGQKLALEPYSKLTAIWGSLALKYYQAGKLDSMKLVLKEGKKRGGFNEAILEIGENVLHSCDSNSILFASGDNFTFSILYVQKIKGKRTDVEAIDLSLLNAGWYGSFLRNTMNSGLLRDSIGFDDYPGYLLKNKHTVEIPVPDCANGAEVFSWKIERLRQGRFMLKSDLILKDIVVKNQFERSIYFTVGQVEESLLSLNNYFTKGILADKLNGCGEDDENVLGEIEKLKFNAIYHEAAKNNADLLNTINIFRLYFIIEADEKIRAQEFQIAQTVMAKMEEMFPEKYFPISDERFRDMILDLKKKADN